MLISESRFRKIINEELKKLMEAGLELEPTPIAGTAPDPKLEAQIKVVRDGKIKLLNPFFTKVAGFLTKYGRQANADILNKNWQAIKQNPPPAGGEELNKWLYGGEIPGKFYNTLDVKNHAGSLIKGLCIISGNYDSRLPSFDEDAAFKLFSGQSAVAADGQTAAPALTDFNAIAQESGGVQRIVENLITFFAPVQQAKAMSAQQSTKTPAAAPAAAGAQATQAPAATQAAAATTPAAQALTYTVRQGDSITKILQQQYKFNPASWNRLPAANKTSIAKMFGTADPNVIIPKRTITLPATLVLGGTTYRLQTAQPASPAKPAMVARPSQP